MSQVPLCKEVYDTLLQYRGQRKVIQMMPGSTDKVFEIHKAETIDIGMTKNSFLKVFKQAHGYWHQHQFTDLNDKSYLTLLDMYYVTVVYLLTTNDNHTLVNVHNAILQQVFARDPAILHDEFEIVTTLVGSRLAKINKNSLLWLHIKRLCILLDIFDPQNTHLYNALIVRLFDACRFHYANYYANDFLAWMIRVERTKGCVSDLLVCNLESICKQNLRDSSVWTCMRVLLRDGENSVVKDYDTTRNWLQNRYRPCAPLINDPHHKGHDKCLDLAPKLFSWLVSVACPYRIPYTVFDESFIPRMHAVIDGESSQPSSHDTDPVSTQKTQFLNTLRWVVQNLEQDIAGR